MKGLIRDNKLLKTSNIFLPGSEMCMEEAIEEEEDEEFPDCCLQLDESKHIHEFIWHPSKKF